MKCRCGRQLHWRKGYILMNEASPSTRIYYCPKCFRSSKECDCQPPRFEIQNDGIIKDRFYEKK